MKHQPDCEVFGVVTKRNLVKDALIEVEDASTNEVEQDVARLVIHDVGER